MIARFVQVAIGLWLMIAPAVLSYGDPAQANDRIFGPVAGGLAFVAVWEVIREVRWAVLPVAAWLVLAPLVLWYGDLAAILNSVACGLALGALTPLGGELSGRYGGGWSVLWSDSTS